MNRFQVNHLWITIQKKIKIHFHYLHISTQKCIVCRAWDSYVCNIGWSVNIITLFWLLLHIDCRCTRLQIHYGNNFHCKNDVTDSYCIKRVSERSLRIGIICIQFTIFWLFLGRWTFTFFLLVKLDCKPTEWHSRVKCRVSMPEIAFFR